MNLERSQNDLPEHHPFSLVTLVSHEWNDNYTQGENQSSMLANGEYCFMPNHYIISSIS